jgi:hypothetical protein
MNATVMSISQIETQASKVSKHSLVKISVEAGAAMQARRPRPMQQ